MKRISENLKIVKVTGQGCLDDCLRNQCEVVETWLDREHDLFGSSLYCVHQKIFGQNFYDAKWSVNL